jgi:hypothetical protein
MDMDTSSAPDPQLLERLVAEVMELDPQGTDPERQCWRVVHRHQHGMLPSEYDIRETDEALYLTLLAQLRSGQT